MSEAKKCDRCKKLYDPTIEEDVPTYKGVKMRKIVVCFGFSWSMHIDLCPSCARAVWDFVKQEDICDEQC